jgi:nitrogen regulatory protein PII
MPINTLFFAIIKKGKANTLLQKAQNLGAEGGTIFLGKGPSTSKLFGKNKLLLSDKEVLMINCNRQLNSMLHKLVAQTKTFAFSLPFAQFQPENKKTKNIPKEIADCIIVIVDKQRGEECLKIAKKAGAKDFIITNGRGAGIPVNYYFPLAIEPEKEIVIIVSPKEKTAQIQSEVYRDLKLDQIGKGILFVLPITKLSNLFVERGRQS